MAAVTEVCIEFCLLLHAWVLEELDGAEIVASSKERTVFGAVDSVDVRVVKTWPDALNWPSEDAGHAGPLNRLGG